MLVSHFSKGCKFFFRTLKVMMDECALGISLMTSLLTPVKCCSERQQGRGLNSRPHSSAFSPLFTGCQRTPGCVSVCAGTHSGLQVYQICFTHLQSTQAGQEGSDLTGPDERPHTHTAHSSSLMVEPRWKVYARTHKLGCTAKTHLFMANESIREFGRSGCL